MKFQIEHCDESHYICENCVQSLYNFQAFYQKCHMVQKQICEYEDLMSQFHTGSDNIIVERVAEVLNVPRPNSDANTNSNTSLQRIRTHDMDEQNNHSTPLPSSEPRRRTGLLNDIAPTSSVGKITARRKSVGPYERKGTDTSRSKSMAPIKFHQAAKRIIAFKLKIHRPHNILGFVLMDRSTKQVLSLDELSFDELSDVKRCVNDPKVLAKIQDQVKSASNVSEEFQNVLRSLVRRQVF